VRKIGEKIGDVHYYFWKEFSGSDVQFNTSEERERRKYLISLSVFNPFLLWLGVMLAIWGVLWFLKRQRKRRGERPPFSDLLLRSPGETLRRQIENISDDVIFYMCTAPVYPLLVYSMVLSGIEGSGTWPQMFLLILGGVVTLGLVWKGVKLIKTRSALRIGLAGEMAVGEELNRLMLDGYCVYHDFPAERFNIDHILVGPSGVFAVETKARSKRGTGDRKAEAKVISDGERLRFPMWVTTEPIDQAKAQAVWLSKWLSSAVGDPVKVSSMVTIPGWYIERKSPNGVPVLNPKQVKAYIEAKKEEVLSESMIKRICHQLEQKCRDVDLWEWY
jgi:hypothetical protein